MSFQETLRPFINAEKGRAAYCQEQHSRGGSAEQPVDALFLEYVAPDREQAVLVQAGKFLLVLNLESHQLRLQNVLRRGEETGDGSSYSAVY